MDLLIRNNFFKFCCVLIVMISTCCPFFVSAQSGSCDPLTPFFNVDLSSNVDSVWVSGPTPRKDHCCGASGSERCIEFLVTLAPTAIAVNFEVAEGANPPGWYYQINCGTQAELGSPICLSAPGPYTLTLCKPGGNLMAYKITTIAAPEGSPDKTVGDGCTTTMSVSGLVTSSIAWTSIFPGATGAYDSYLNCASACTSPIVTPASGHPVYVDYRVCGIPIAGICGLPGQFCDTIRVYMSDPILNTVTPNPAAFCVNNPTVTLTGTVNGGVAPYTYAWTNAANGAGTVVGTGISYNATAVGNYSFIVYDQNYPACPASIVNVPVTSTPLPIVNAGPDKISCGSSVNISGTVTGASGGIWSGGLGSFTLGNTALMNTYTPTLAERTSGTVILTLTSTGNGACNAVSDQVTLFLSPPLTAGINAPAVICSGETVALTANATGGTGPFTYLWNTGATSQTISTATAGTYSVTITGAGPTFCTASASASLTANSPIVITTTPNNAVACADSILISASATGGAGGYTYLWSNSATTAATNVNTGTYGITITDAAGCQANSSVSVTASSGLNVSLNQPGVICNGTTATLNSTVTGGLGSFSYLWDTGETTSSLTTGAGNHCLTVTDNGGCISSACANITENPAITVTIPVPATVCNGASTTATATASGGQAPFTYLWNTGATTASLTATAGTYTLTVTDLTGCTKTATVTISQAPLLVVTASTVPVSCAGGSNGTATAAASGGTLPYSYAWSPFGGTGTTASNLTAGTYSVIVTDGLGCSADTSIAVSQPVILTASSTVINHVSCKGGSNGSASITPAGGTSPYTYAWNPGGAITQSVNTLSAGTYTITVTDNKNCTAITQVTITEPAAVLSASISSIAHISCNGGSNGSAAITASGGTPGYTYLWAPGGATTATVSNLVAGSHTVTVTDSKSCTTPLTVTITQPAVLSSVINTISHVKCNGQSNGAATVAASGGTAPYTYSWNTSPVQTTATVTNLVVGTYTATVTDANSCVSTSTVPITEPPVLTLVATPSVAVPCDSSVNISSLASGGTPAYNYLWNTGANTAAITVNIGSYYVSVSDANNCSASDTVNITANNSTLAVSIPTPPNICHGSTIALIPTISGGVGGFTYLWNTGATTSSIIVGAGSYCVTVTDALGCIVTGCVTVIENPILSMNVGTPPNVCPGDSATVAVSASGGQQPYTYLWNTGETTQSVTKPAGTYTVTLTDAVGSGCAASASVTISEQAPISTTVNSTDVGCYGAANGTVIVYATGGLPAYSYSWSPGGATTASVNHLGPATYIVTVTDALGCVRKDTAVVTQPLTPVSIVISGTDNICFGDSAGTAMVVASGGTAPYYYYWSFFGDTLSAIGNLPAGTYIATVADTTGCYLSDTIVISEPTELQLTATAQQFSCFGETGSASLVASGGTPAYAFSGSDSVNLVAGTYTYIVTDNNGCVDSAQAIINPGPPAFTLTATPSQISCFGGTGSVQLAISGGVGPIVVTGDDTTALVAGTYNYTVTDSNGCTATAQAVISPAPQPFTLTATVSEINCFGETGSVSLATSGGVGTFVFSGSDTVNLVAGTYNYTVTDSTGCTATAQAIIAPAPAPFTLTATPSQISCFGGTGSVQLAISGGVGPIVLTGDDTTALIAGTYNYTATDSTGCIATAQATISTQPDSLTLTAIATQINCFGETGSVQLVASGGTGTLLISGDDTTNLIAGTYNYTVTDSNGCTANAQAVINPAPQPFTLTATVSEINCFGETGSVSLATSGGVGTFVFSGDNDTVNLEAGTYDYTVTDSTGCTASVQATIAPGPAPFTLTATSTQISCFGGRGSVSLAITGGIGTVVITGDDTTNLVAGNYTYTATDSTGCTATAQAVIAVAPDSLTVSIMATQVSCFGGSNGTATATVNGGTAPFQYLWSTASTTASLTGLAAGSFSVGIIDDHGCTATDSTVISEPSNIILTTTSTASTCGLNNGSATVGVSGGTGSYTYSWSPSGGTAAIADSLPAGNYIVTVSDSNNCQKLDTVIVDAASYLIANFNATAECLNTPNVFTDSSIVSPGDTITSWVWDFGDSGASDTSTSPTHLYTSSGTYNVSLTVSASNGCINTIISPVLVHALPSVNFASSKVCLNATTAFTDLSVAGPGDAVNTWLWDFGDMTSTVATQNPTHSYTLSGDYTATLIVTTIFGCTDTANENVTVYPNPVVQFAADDSSGCGMYCPFFTDLTNVSGTTITGWQWNFGDNSPIGTNANGEHCYMNTGAYSVSLTVTTAQGCSSTGTQNNFITVYQSPNAEFGFTPSSPTTLIASDIYFDNESTGANSWNWDFGDMNDTTGSNAQFPTHTYSDTGTYCITLIVKNIYQCADTVVNCLEIEPDFTFYIPNAFSPYDSPGVNDGFSGYGTNIKQYDMWIFDRWGDMLFHTSDLSIKWDGKANNGKEIAQRDVYVYLVKIIDFRGGEHQYRGTVTLVR